MVMITRLESRLLAALLGTVLLGGLSAEAEGQGLFGPSGGEIRASEEVLAVYVYNAATAPSETVTLRTRTATVDLAALTRARAAVLAQPAGPGSVQSASRSGPRETLVLNLFDDARFTGLVRYTAPTYSGGFSLSGGLAEDPLGSMTFVINDGRVLGTVRSVEGVFEIRSAGGGSSSISEVLEAPLECGVVDGPHSAAEHLEHLR